VSAVAPFSVVFATMIILIGLVRCGGVRRKWGLPMMLLLRVLRVRRSVVGGVGWCRVVIEGWRDAGGG
jgi:hypothetical protein